MVWGIGFSPLFLERDISGIIFCFGLVRSVISRGLMRYYVCRNGQIKSVFLTSPPLPEVDEGFKVVLSFSCFVLYGRLVSKWELEYRI